jgi:diguanylate cyclase (GGDEF)-like protein
MEIEYKDKMLKIGDKYQHDLVEASKRIINIKDIDELSKTIINILLINTNAKSGVFYLFNKEAGLYIKKFEEGKRKKPAIESFDEGSSLIRLLLDINGVVDIGQLRKLVKEMGFRYMVESVKIAEEIECEMILPIILDNLLGFICLGGKKNGEVYGNADRNAFELITYTSAMVIQNIFYSVDIVLDPLTRIYNKKYCDEQLVRSINQSVRHREVLSCVMIDIDYFKTYNDKFGHQYGDIVLRKVAEYLKSMVRPNDFVCRYGGEEFIMILPGTDLEGAHKISERTRKEITKKLELKEPITISLGIGTLISDIIYREGSEINMDAIKKEFIERSDKALYEAKHSGRNRVCLSEELKLKNMKL